MILKKLDLRVCIYHSTSMYRFHNKHKYSYNFSSRWDDKLQFSNYIFSYYLNTISKNLNYSKGAKRNASMFLLWLR